MHKNQRPTNKVFSLIFLGESKSTTVVTLVRDFGSNVTISCPEVRGKKDAAQVKLEKYRLLNILLL